MLWLKSCPRCSGDLFDDRDMYGDYIACIQCGHYLSEVEIIVLLHSHAARARRLEEVPAGPDAKEPGIEPQQGKRRFQPEKVAAA